MHRYICLTELIIYLFLGIAIYSLKLFILPPAAQSEISCWAHVAESGLLKAEFITRQCPFIGWAWATPVTSEPVEGLYFTTEFNSE